MFSLTDLFASIINHLQPRYNVYIATNKIIHTSSSKFDSLHKDYFMSEKKFNQLLICVVDFLKDLIICEHFSSKFKEHFIYSPNMKIK